MKILLDECLPKKLKRRLEEHTVITVQEQGWSGTKNGELLQLMEDEGSLLSQNLSKVS